MNRNRERILRLVKNGKTLNLENILDKLAPEERAFVMELIDRDPLTGVYNRRKLDRDLPIFRSLEKRDVTGSSLIFIDIDNFKKYNDAYGHQEGDQALKDVARCIEGSLREYDRIHIYRYGGEEFVVIIPHTSPKEGRIIAERLRRNVKETTRVTVSLGVTHYRKISDDLGSLIRDADTALYQAKDKGRDQVQVYKSTT